MSAAPPVSAQEWYTGVLGSAVEFGVAAVGLAIALLLIYVGAIGVTRIMERSGRTRGSGALGGWLFVQVWVVVICASVWAAQVPLLFSEPGSDPSWESGLDLAITAVGAAAGGAIFSMSLALLVPRRGRTGPLPRILGTGAMISRVAALVLYCAAVPATIALGLWMDSGLVLTALVSGALFFSIVGLARALVAGSRRMAPEAVVEKTEVVLYLRPFAREYELFADGVNFETYVGGEIAQIAPLVALGSPTERLPPRGASRVYAGDAEWQGWVDDLAARAVCIIGTTASSSNTAWELARIRRMGFQTKLFLVTPPGGEPDTTQGERPSRCAALRFSAGLWAGMRLWGQNDLRGIIGSLSWLRPPSSMSQLTLPDWADLVHTLTDCGYQVEQPDPGPGSVLTFDPQGGAMLVSKGACSPAEYVDAIVRAIRTGHG